MTLTSAQEALLTLPFRLDEHGFNGSHNVYLLKSAIRRRLSLVDPGWSLSQPVLVQQTANTVQLSASLTICGSTRSATGVAIINRWKKDAKDNRIEMIDYDLALAQLKAQKNADSDLLPRIAVNGFNVGAYLKVEAIKSVKTPEALKAFLDKLPPPPGAHWSANGGRERVAAFLKLLNLKWDDIKDLIEPGHALSGLSDTMLDESHFMLRLAELAYKPAEPKILSLDNEPVPSNPAPIPPTLAQSSAIPRNLRPPKLGAGIYCAPADLAKDDLLSLSAPDDRNPIIVKVVDIQYLVNEYVGVIKYAAKDAMESYKFTDALYRVVGGPKPELAEKDVSLVELKVNRWIWVGKPAEQAAVHVIECDLKYLAVDDVLDQSSGSTIRYERITQIGDYDAGVRAMTLFNTQTEQSRETRLSNIRLYTIIGGPKIAAVNADPVAHPKNGAGFPVWHEPTQVAVS